MFIGEALRQIAADERAACPDTMRQAVLSARTPIEQWRASDTGQALERQLADALVMREQDKRRVFAELLTRHPSWLPSYLSALFGHAATDSGWQPPLSDFASQDQTGLCLIERDGLRLCLILLPRLPDVDETAHKVIPMSSGHVMVCPVTPNSSICFRRWQRTESNGIAHIAPLPDAIIGYCEPLYCQLSRTYMRPYDIKQPIVMLRMEWPEEGAPVYQYFHADTGAPLPRRMGSDRFRRHMAISVLSAVTPDLAKHHLTNAIASAPDDGLAWHYTRQLLAIAPLDALPILEQQMTGNNAALRALAEQTMAVLRAHYAPLFEAA